MAKIYLGIGRRMKVYSILFTIDDNQNSMSPPTLTVAGTRFIWVPAR